MIQNQSNAEENNTINEGKENNCKDFALTHLMPKNTGKIRYNFIANIIKYKKTLNVFPYHKVIE